MTEPTPLTAAALEAFRIRHNAEMQLASIGEKALGLIGATDPDLQEAANKLFKDSNKAGLWFVTPDTRTGKSPLQEYNDGHAAAIKSRLAFAQALSGM